jgi:uncharacterized LabA/DUF88 family protein
MKAGVDEFTLVAGDSDYVPVVEDLVARGFKFDVAFLGSRFARIESGLLQVHLP